MGDVFRAYDTRSGETVAVKVIREPGTFEPFQREAKALDGLRHPKIVQYLEHGVTACGQAWLAMEWLDGEDLASRLQRGCLSVADTLALAKSLAGALHWAHTRGLVHRDLKPANVFLRDGACKEATLLDFGVAKACWSEGSTEAWGFVGTLFYTAPEQAVAPHSVDARADLFSFGCVLYECLTGERPFFGRSTGAVLEKLWGRTPPAPHRKRPEVPEALSALVHRLLAKFPDERPADAAEVMRTLAAMEGPES